jgi:hypothetical protein
MLTVDQTWVFRVTRGRLGECIWLPAFFLRFVMIDWLIDWLMDWLWLDDATEKTDWLDWLTNWVVGTLDSNWLIESPWFRDWSWHLTDVVLASLWTQVTTSSSCEYCSPSKLAFTVWYVWKHKFMLILYVYDSWYRIILERVVVLHKPFQGSNVIPWDLLVAA